MFSYELNKTHVPFKLMKSVVFGFCILFSGIVISDESLAYVSGKQSGSSSVTLPAVDCVINPYRVVDVASPVRGVIEKVMVERSDQISKGQVVATLSAGVEEASVALAKSRTKIRSEIKAGQINLAYDKRRKQRIESLHNKKAISTELSEQASREQELSDWKLVQARELAEVRVFELRRAQEQLKQKTIISPVDGFVLDTFKYTGEYVEDQAIMRIAQLDPLIVEAIVPMENFGQIKVGMTAEIHPEVIATGGMQGKVTVVDRIGDTASGTYGVRLVMPNPNNRLPAGIKCVVKFNQNSVTAVSSADTQKSGESAVPTEAGSKNLVTASEQKVAVAVNDNQSGKSEGASEQALSKPDTGNDVAQLYRAPQIKPGGFVEFDQVASMRGTSEIFYTHLRLESRDVTDFIVLLSKGVNAQGTRNRVRMLREQGMNDFQLFDTGPYKGFISLGISPNPKFASKHMKKLQKMGIVVVSQ